MLRYEVAQTLLLRSVSQWVGEQPELWVSAERQIRGPRASECVPRAIVESCVSMGVMRAAAVMGSCVWTHVRGEWTCEYACGGRVSVFGVAKNTDVRLRVHKGTRGGRWQDWSVPRQEGLPG